MHPVLRLYEDILSSAENVEFRLAALPRFIFVVHGSATIDGKTVNEGGAWQGSDATTVKPGAEGVTCWRWELARGDQGATVACAPGMVTREKLSAYLETMPKGDLLMRCDSVAFPPGGCAWQHSHQGPGIRCLIEGGIRIDTHGRSTSYGVGGAWYESGPDAVFAQAATDRQSRFIRVMILPRELTGNSSISYVNEDDKAKPKSQTYKIYADAAVEFLGNGEPTRMTGIDRQQAFSGTKDASPALRLDAARLENYLTAHVAGFVGPLTVAQFKGGQSNPTYLLTTPVRRYVLRRKPPGKLLPSAHAVDREFRVIGALHAQHFPVAEPLYYCSDDSVAGTPFYVMSFADGRVFWEPQMPGSNPSERAAVYDAMNATIARLHAFDPAQIGLGDFGRGENYVARQVDRWSKQYRASETEKIDAMERLIDWLPCHIPPAGAARLVHGDYRIDNLVVAKDAPQVLAVLDWELSTLGDPLADFTYHLMAWHMPMTESAAGTATLAGHELAALGIPSMSSYVDTYVSRTKLDPRPHLPVYLAYNFFRIAAILQGIIGRVRDGTATSEFAPAKADMIRPLADTAWDFARQTGAR